MLEPMFSGTICCQVARSLGAFNCSTINAAKMEEGERKKGGVGGETCISWKRGHSWKRGQKGKAYYS